MISEITLGVIPGGGTIFSTNTLPVGTGGNLIVNNFNSIYNGFQNIGVSPSCIYVSTNGNDSTGERGNANYPFLTLNAAISACQSGDSILIGIGIFSPLTVTIPSWVRLIGSGKPHVDSITSPTMLVGGTVIKGPLGAINDGFELWHAGVDCGSVVCAALYSNGDEDALYISNVPTQTIGVTPLKGCRIIDVIALARSSSSLCHACRVENVQEAIINGIETWFGVHGLAFKGINSNISNHIANGHGATSHYIKSDNYAPCGNVNSTNISCNVVGSSGSGVNGAVCADGYTASLGPVNISNVTIGSGFSVGMEFNASAGMSSVNLANVEITSATTPFVYNGGSQPLIFPQNVTINGVLLPALGSFRSVSFNNGNGGPTVSTGCLEYVGGTAYLLAFGPNNSTIGSLTLGSFSSDFSLNSPLLSINHTGVKTTNNTLDDGIGNLVLGGSLTFPDSTVQTTAGLPLTGGTMTGQVLFDNSTVMGAGTTLQLGAATSGAQPTPIAGGLFYQSDTTTVEACMDGSRWVPVLTTAGGTLSGQIDMGGSYALVGLVQLIFPSAGQLTIEDDGPFPYMVFAGGYTSAPAPLNLGATPNTTKTSPLNVAGIPTSNSGLSSGDVYSNFGVLTIVP